MPESSALRHAGFPHHRIDLPCPRDIGVAALVVAHEFFHGAAQVNGGGKSGRQRNRLAVILDRAIIFALRLIGRPAGEKGRGVAGVELDRLVQILDRMGIIALLVIGRTPRDIGVCRIGAQRDGLAVIQDRAVSIALVEQRMAARQIALQVARIQADRLVTVLDRAVMIAGIVDRHAAVFEGNGAIHVGFIARLDNRGTSGDDEIVIVDIGALRPILVTGLCARRPGRQPGQRRDNNPKDMAHRTRLPGFLETGFLEISLSARGGSRRGRC